MANDEINQIKKEAAKLNSRRVEKEWDGLAGLTKIKTGNCLKFYLKRWIEQLHEFFLPTAAATTDKLGEKNNKLQSQN